MKSLARVMSVPARVLRVSSWEIFRLSRTKPKNIRCPDFRSLTHLESELIRYQEIYTHAHQNLLREWVRYGRLDLADRKEISRFSLMRTLASKKVSELYAELNAYDAAWHSRYMP